MSAVIFGLALALAGPDCTRDDLTQVELNDCALAEFNQTDAELNRQWKLTFAAFQKRSPGDGLRLRDAQRAWIRFRDTQCDAERPWHLGVQMDKMLNINCRTEMTLERTEKLKEMALEAAN